MSVQVPLVCLAEVVSTLLVLLPVIVRILASQEHFVTQVAIYCFDVFEFIVAFNSGHFSAISITLNFIPKQ